MACSSHWCKLITGKSTTVYTDSAVAVNNIRNFQMPTAATATEVGDRIGHVLALSKYCIPHALTTE
eukprot:6182916-Pleurochrysis_carterae.AAC.1